MGRRPAERWIAVAEWCRENPGEWALVTDDGPVSWATHINQGRIAAFRPAGQFEGIARQGNAETDRGSIFCRFVKETT